MDVYCPVCGEPWDQSSLHEAVSEGRHVSYEDAAKHFIAKGCETFGSRHGEVNRDQAALAQEVYALLGTDLDAAASEFEDFQEVFGG